MSSMIALAATFGAAADTHAQQGGFGGLNGGGPRPTGSTSAGMNRAGTSSSGGFAYGDAPKEPAAKAATKPPCKAPAVSVNGVPHYKCGKNWYAEPRTGEGYAKVSPPPGN